MRVENIFRSHDRHMTTAGALLTLLLVLGGAGACNGPVLRRDPVLPSNYPTAEFYACGAHWHGLGTCLVERGRPIDSIDLSIQGYAQGAMRVVSESCGLDDTFRYSSSQRVNYSIPGLAQKSCLLTIVVLPEFSGEETAGVPIRSFKGSLWVRVTDPDEQVAVYRSALQVNSDTKISINAPAELTTAHAIFRGCDTQFEQDVPVVDGKLSIALSQIFSDLSEIRRCVLAGRIDLPTNSFYVSWMVWTYGEKYSPLSIPFVSLSSKSLRVTADKNVTVIWLDNDFRYSNDTSFKFDQSKPHTLRVLTTGGRSVIGDWIVDEKRFDWKQ